MAKIFFKQWRLERYSSELNDYKEKCYFIDVKKENCHNYLGNINAPRRSQYLIGIESSLNKNAITVFVLRLNDGVGKKIFETKQWIINTFVNG